MLAVVLPLCGQLTELMVHMNSFGVAGMIALAGAMGALDKLEKLVLGMNAIGDEGMSALAKAITPDKDGRGALDNLKVS